MKESKALYITKAAIIAALYVILTIFGNVFGLSNGIIQIRISEALTILPFFIPSAVPGLFVGCLIGNLVTGCLPWDIIFGSLATLIGAVGTLHIGKIRTAQNNPKWKKWLAPLSPILSNTLIIPVILIKVYNIEGAYAYFMLTIGIGEILSAGVLGILLLSLIEKRFRNRIDL